MENNLEDWYGMEAMDEHMRLEALFPVAPGGGATMVKCHPSPFSSNIKLYRAVQCSLNIAQQFVCYMLDRLAFCCVSCVVCECSASTAHGTTITSDGPLYPVSIPCD